VIYFHRRNPLRKCNLPNRIKRIGQPDGHAGWTVASNVPLPPPPPCSAYKRDAICPPRYFRRKDSVIKLICSTGLNVPAECGGENKFLALFENSCWKYEKRVTKTDSRFHEIVNTWPFVLSRVNRFSSDRDSCHYNRIFIDRITL
jgi:hypothetical protein